MNERVTATGIMLFSNTLGLSFGFLTSVYYVVLPSLINTYMFYLALCLSLAFVLGLFVFRDKPNKLANLSSGNSNKMEVIQNQRISIGARWRQWKQPRAPKAWLSLLR